MRDYLWTDDDDATYTNVPTSHLPTHVIHELLNSRIVIEPNTDGPSATVTTVRERLKLELFIREHSLR